jgi:hypothetical protein
MTTPTAAPIATGPDVPLFPVAGAFLEGLAAQDFPVLAGTLDEHARMTALVPAGIKVWEGREQIAGIFRGWFGEVQGFELVEAFAGEVAARLQLRWRVRVRAEGRGDGWFVVEQQVYADTGSDGRIHRLFLLCSGFWPETTAAVAR